MKKKIKENWEERFEKFIPMDFCNDGKYTKDEMIDCLSEVIKANYERIKQFIQTEIEKAKDEEKRLKDIWLKEVAHSANLVQKLLISEAKLKSQLEEIIEMIEKSEKFGGCLCRRYLEEQKIAGK